MLISCLLHIILSLRWFFPDKFLCLLFTIPLSSVVLIVMMQLQEVVFHKYTWALIFVGVAAAVVAGVGYLGRKEREEGYESIIM